MSALTRAMTEDELLQAITGAATYRGWRWHHVRRSDKALQMGHSGFPDLVLARAGRVLFIELKAEKGKAREDQIAWINAVDPMESDHRVRAFFAFPQNLDHVLAILE